MRKTMFSLVAMVALLLFFTLSTAPILAQNYLYLTHEGGLSGTTFEKGDLIKVHYIKNGRKHKVQGEIHDIGEHQVLIGEEWITAANIRKIGFVQAPAKKYTTAALLVAGSGLLATMPKKGSESKIGLPQYTLAQMFLGAGLLKGIIFVIDINKSYRITDNNAIFIKSTKPLTAPAENKAQAIQTSN